MPLGNQFQQSFNTLLGNVGQNYPGAYKPGATTRANPFNTAGINDWEDKYRTTQRGMSEQLWDFSSPFYSAYRNYLAQSIPGVGAGSFLSMLQAGGGNYANSMAQAMQLKKQTDRERTDAINLGTMGFARGNVGEATNLVSQGLQSVAQKEAQIRAIKAQEGGFLDAAGGILGNVFGNVMSGFNPLNFFGGSANKMQAQPFGGY